MPCHVGFHEGTLAMQDDLCLFSTVFDLSASEKNKEGVLGGDGCAFVLAPQAWFPLLQSKSVQEPWKFPLASNPLWQGPLSHPCPQELRLMACLLSSKG